MRAMVVVAMLLLAGCKEQDAETARDIAQKRNDKIIRMSFYTKGTLGVVAFTELVQEIVPAVEMVIR